MVHTLERNPWRTVSTREVYKNAWIRIREDAVIRPDGKEGIYGVVEARTAVGVIARTPDNQIYLVGQYRYPVEEYSWEIIEGGAEHEEDALNTAKRELHEEAGLCAERYTQLGPEVHLSNCFSTERAVFFLAEGLTEVGAAPEGTEVLQLKKMPLDEVLSLVHTGAIKDAMSILALSRLEYAIRTGKVR
jgi:8-oxo-dGTP pyrophosphatase MutT (NUDIX family)